MTLPLLRARRSRISPGFGEENVSVLPLVEYKTVKILGMRQFPGPRLLQHLLRNCLLSFLVLNAGAAVAQDALYFTKTNRLYGFELLPRDRSYLEKEVSCDIFRLSPIAPNGHITLVTHYANDAGGGARDPEIGANGLYLYYSARDSFDDGWQIFRLSLLTGQVTQLTTSPPGERWYDNMNPRVVGTHTNRKSA